MNFLETFVSIDIAEEWIGIASGEILLTLNRIMALSGHQNFVSVQYFENK